MAAAKKEAKKLDGARQAANQVAAVGRFVRTTVSLIVIWAELELLALLVAAGAIIHASGDGLIVSAVALLLPVVAVLLPFKASWRRAIAKNIHDTVAMRYRPKRKIKATMRACGLVTRDPESGEFVYPDCVVTVGPLMSWREMRATLWMPRVKPDADGDEFQATHRIGGWSAAWTPRWLEYNIALLPSIDENKFRSGAEKALKLHHDFLGAKSQPLDNRLIFRLSQETEPYALEVVSNVPDDEESAWAS